ncbi:SMP-30/gluconolactonase/LRE family protein [Diaminobutyricibacter sp. McL0618]|uniref:SMP-30/gluconolactonase/LRE family protein n=1 Tax=Leifsonia sp. McL0618 TaxID=3415677 RepID=UPI003CEF98EB
MNRINAEPFSTPLTEHGEGPVWLGERGLAVLDMLAGDVLLVDSAGRLTDRIHVDVVAAAARPRKNGGLVVGIERGFALLDTKNVIESHIECWDDRDVRMNEGATDPWGRFWCGSMANNLTPGAGAMWRLDPDGTTQRLFDQVGCSNGLAWSVDGHSAFFVDSLSDRIDRLTFSPAGELTGRETHVDLGGIGFADGLTVDAEGGIWLALFDGGRLVHFDAAGTADAEIVLPVRQVTACAFGGDNLSNLYISTSRYAMERPEPLAGALFVARPTVGGLPVPAFAG